MKKKRYIQACEVNGSMYGKKTKGRRASVNHENIRKKDLIDVYNRFFKDQVEALYRAIHHGR
jgi:hypothetical protein